ncbi:MAG TPA: MerR family transcriptional regulator [Mycobacteriales bacterium]|nr:MerR family transcriptional regulator [Mycobacteriales bacterium]
MSADPLLSIGVFARRSWLSMKALRLYDRLGLLTPAHVDPVTGRRGYRESQLFTARLIGMLRRLDMPLAQVAAIVTASGPAGADLLADYWAALERRRAAQAELVSMLRLSLAGGDGRFDAFTVRERDVPEHLVLTARRHLRPADLSCWLRETRAELVRAAAACGGVVAEVFVIFHGAVTADSDGPVEVCVPVARVGGTEPPSRIEPAHREAYVRVTKAQFELPQILSAYDAVERWIGENGLRAAGSPREIYRSGVDVPTAELAEEICDVAYPIQ